MRSIQLAAIIVSMTLLAAGTGTSCCDPAGANPLGCPSTAPPPAGQPINVAGTFRYSGRSFLSLRGTITFTQEGDQVRVTGATYDNSGDRDLVGGPAPIVGDTLNIVLVPKNGDPDYRADIKFVFTADGSQFSVQYSDTNGDAGDLGSYRGTRQNPP